MPSSGETMEDVFRQWNEAILLINTTTTTRTTTTATIINTTNDLPSLLRLQDEAKNYFSSVVVVNSQQQRKSDTTTTTTTTTGSCVVTVAQLQPPEVIVSLESAIALLIQLLQPCFASVPQDSCTIKSDSSSTTISKSSTSGDTRWTTTTTSSLTTTTAVTVQNRIYLALSCIVGSLQGCINNNHHHYDHNLTPAPTSLLSVPFLQLVSTFLYPYIGPIDFEQQQQHQQPQEHEITSGTTAINDVNVALINYDTEQIRDLAMEGLIALLQCSKMRRITNIKEETTTAPADPTNSWSNTTAATTTTTTINEWMQLLCSMATKGVENRCTIIDDQKNNNYINNNYSHTMDMIDGSCNDNEDAMYGFNHNHTKQTTAKNSIDDGMALLPRKRRSLCFTLLQETIYSIVSNCTHKQQQSNPSTGTNSTISRGNTTPTLQTITTFMEFIQFVSSCLHGESDPRCLLQLLELFYTILVQCYPLLSFDPSSIGRNTINNNNNNNTNINNRSTIINMFFDSVVPYYPIQFQPPPNNDIYGITRISLRQAIMRILSCTLYDSATEMDQNSIDLRDYNDDYDSSTTSMCTLTSQLLLDCLLPAPNDEPLNTTEQMEVLEDMQHFLFTTCQYDISYPNLTTYSPNCDINTTNTNLEKLHMTQQRSIAEALIVLHETSSLTVSKDISNINKNSKAKQLTDLCRSMIATIAITSERMTVGTQEKNHWSMMVEEPVRRLSQELFASSTNARIAIAYIACVASSGGHKTLNLCLEFGLAKLLSYLRESTPLNDYSSSNETVVTAIYGIGAFFASCRAAIDVALRDGIQWYPHPLQSYSKEALQLILNYLYISDKTQNDSFVLVHVAAIRTLESILMVSPITLIELEQIDELIICLEKLSMQSNSTTEGLSRAYSETLGTLLGCVLDSQDPTLSEAGPICDHVIIHSEHLRQYFLDRLLPSLLKSGQNVAFRRHDGQLLAKATAYSLRAASYILQTLAKSLHEALVASNDESAKSIAVSLNFLFEQDNQFAAHAYHELSHPNITAFDILSVLVPTTSKPRDNMEALFGISALQLPTSNEDRRKNSVALEKAYGIILQLRRGYEHEMSSARLQKLLDWVERVIPPLSDTDTVRLSIALPLLSAAMENSGSVSMTYIGIGSKNVGDTICGMIDDLTEFIISPENHPIARMHAARCVHSSIAYFTPHTLRECPVHNLTKNRLIPSLRLSLRTLSEMSQSHQHNTAKAIFIDNLNMLAMLCSAAACRGGTSAKSSDNIMLFLVDLACKRKSDTAFADGGGDMIDLIAFDTSHDQKESNIISIHVASLIGSILNTDCRGNGLWRQRLIHTAVKRILAPHINGSGSYVDSFESDGTLIALCHVLCSANIPAILTPDQKIIVGTIVSMGLSSSAVQVADPSTLKIVLVTILKTICTDLSCFRSIYALVAGTLRVYASVDESKNGLMCKILALQVLTAVAQMGENDFSAMEIVNVVRPAVLSLLGIAVDHPLAALRSAAIDVRNTWYVVP